MTTLFPGEKLKFEQELSQAHADQNDSDVNEKYERGDIRIVTEQARYPLNTIVTMLDSGDYILNPEFQRRHRWLNDRKSRLIESFIMNVPIPPIFLYEISYSKYEVMDGLQRLTAISEFYKGQFALTGLREWSELNGRYYYSLPDQVRRGIDRRYLSSIILLRETAKDSRQAQSLKQMVFERINSGGEKLEPQESRNALYNGRLNQMCIELAELTSFRLMWGIPVKEMQGGQLSLFSPAAESLYSDSEEIDSDEPESDEQPLSSGTGEVDNSATSETDLQYARLLRLHPLYRTMSDVELVLRFFAFRQYEDQGRLRDYLDLYLKHGNLYPDSVLGQLKQLFIETADLVYDVLGEQAFFLRRPRKNSSSGWVEFERPTKVVYDAMMYAFSHRLEFGDVLRRRSANVRNKLATLYEKRHAAFAGRSTNKSDTKTRRELMLGLLDEVIGEEASTVK